MQQLVLYYVQMKQRAPPTTDGPSQPKRTPTASHLLHSSMSQDLTSVPMELLSSASTSIDPTPEAATVNYAPQQPADIPHTTFHRLLNKAKADAERRGVPFDAASLQTQQFIQNCRQARQAYKCNKCGREATKATGHSRSAQLGLYCSQTDGPFAQWKEQKLAKKVKA